jgi:hypothetical protein
MSLETQIIALATAIGTDVKALIAADGNLSALTTTSKSSLVGAINEIASLVESLNLIEIDDSAGNGATTVTWSADKIFDSIEAAKTAVKDALTDGASAALDTLAELADALNNDPDFAATLATQIANRVRFDAAQSLTSTQMSQARQNIDAFGSVEIGDPDHNFVADYEEAKT